MDPMVCRSCVMDTTDTQITFDNSGVCDHCNRFHSIIQPAWERSRNSFTLERLSKKIKRQARGSAYDCLIGVSGGVDSSYLLHLAVQEMNLNPLVLHVDAGWNSDLATRNIEVLVDELDLDLHTIIVDWDEMKDVQRAFFKAGVPHLDAPQDYAFFAAMYDFAAKNNVKAILTGGNYSTECVRNPIEWMYYQSDDTQLRDIHRRFGQRNLDAFPRTSILWHKVYLPFIKNIKVYRPLDLVDYLKIDAMELLVNEYGWEPYPQKHFESRFTRFYEGYWLPKRFGYDVRKVQYSSLILTKQLERSEAILMLEAEPWSDMDIDSEFDFVAKKLDFSRHELDHHFNSPLRSYKDYANERWVYNLGRRVLQTFTGLGDVKR
jgi:N-acetyl sugar amidotransferase